MKLMCKLGLAVRSFMRAWTILNQEETRRQGRIYIFYARAIHPKATVWHNNGQEEVDGAVVKFENSEERSTLSSRVSTRQSL
jgi:hypothetical protein